MTDAELAAIREKNELAKAAIANDCPVAFVRPLTDYVDALLAEVGRPVWTDATPTAPGLYWHRKRPGKVPSVVLVEEGDGGHLIDDLDERIDGKGGQWAPAVGPAEPKQI